MARLPQAADLPRRPTPAATPDVRVPGIDFGQAAAGARALGQGVEGLGQGLRTVSANLKADSDEVDDYETAKRLMDFKLQTELDLEDHKRAMPVGGTGYSESWSQRYTESARAFVGDKDGNIPESQRRKVGLALKQWDTTLRERAARDENGERDRATVAGLETTVQTQRSRVETDPNAHDEVQSELSRLIDLAPLTPAQRDQFKRKVREGVAESAGQAWADRATTAEGREQARRVLAPHLPDKRAGGGLSATLRDQVKQFEGFTPQAQWDYKQHSNGYGTKARFPGERIDKAEAEKRLDQELASAAQIVDRFAPNLEKGTRDALISLTFNAGSEWTNKGLGQAIKAGDMERAKQLFVQYNRAGGEVLPGLAKRRQSEAQWFGKVGNNGPADGGYMDAGAAGAAEYAGPFADLPLAKRRALMDRADAAFKRTADETQKAIREQMAASEKGVLPPDAWMEVMAPRVKAINDPATTALFTTMLGKAETTARLRQAPPMALEMHATQLRDRLTSEGGTKEQEEYVAHVEKLAAETRKETSDNAIGWARRNAIVVPLGDGKAPADIEPSKRAQWEEMHAKAFEMVRSGKTDEAMRLYPGMFQKAEMPALDFGRPDIGDQLDQRLTTAKGVGRYYGQPVQAFSRNERQFLGNILKNGGEPMLAVMGQIANAAARNGVDTSFIMREIAPPDAPELAMIGHLVANNGDPVTLQTAATALKWKIGQKERFESTINKTQAQPSLGDYADVLKTSPTSTDSLKHLANLVYEYEARAAGDISTFNQARYDGIVHRLMGETKGRDGVAYGGVGRQGAGWMDGKWATNILVPSAIRQDGFDRMLLSLRADDLMRMGGQPVDERGKPYAMSEVRAMTWTSVGPPGAPPVPGVYTLKIKDDATGRPIYAMGSDGRPIVLDVRPVLDDVRKRTPSIFMGHQAGMEFDSRPPDPAYPAYMAPRKSKEEEAAQTRTGMDRRSTMPRSATQGLE